MNLHEYQAKGLLAEYGVPVPAGHPAGSADAARAAAERLGGEQWMVKAQVHVGGRGKAGGVKLAAGPEDAEAHAAAILGMDIKGLTVEEVLVTDAVDIDKEYYIGIVVDRASKMPVYMVSEAGGIDIEQVAGETPEKIHKLRVDPVVGLTPYLQDRRGLRHSGDG